MSMKAYVTERVPQHPLAGKSGTVLQHRRIWFDANGPIPKGHVIHHRNGDPKDNRIENLECLTRTEHMREHWPHGFRSDQRKPPEYVDQVCTACGVTFKRLAWRIADNNKRAGRQLRPTCNRKCWSVLCSADRGYRVALKRE